MDLIGKERGGDEAVAERNHGTYREILVSSRMKQSKSGNDLLFNYLQPSVCGVAVCAFYSRVKDSLLLLLVSRGQAPA